MTGPDLPVEAPHTWPVHPTTSSTQPAPQKPTDTDGAATEAAAASVARALMASAAA